MAEAPGRDRTRPAERDTTAATGSTAISGEVEAEATARTVETPRRPPAPPAMVAPGQNGRPPPVRSMAEAEAEELRISEPSTTTPAPADPAEAEAEDEGRARPLRQAQPEQRIPAEAEAPRGVMSPAAPTAALEAPGS